MSVQYKSCLFELPLLQVWRVLSENVFLVFVFFSVVGFTKFVQSSEQLASIFILVKVFLVFFYVLLSMLVTKKAHFYVALFLVFLIPCSLFHEKLLPYALYFFLAYSIADKSSGYIEGLFVKAAFLSLALCLLVFSLNFIGVLDGGTYVNTLGYAQESRHSLGFFNPNPASLLMVSAIFVFLYYGRYWLFMAAYLIFWFFQIWLASRTYMYIALLLPFFLFFIYMKASAFLAVGVMFLVASVPLVAIGFDEYEQILVMGLDINAFMSNRLFVLVGSFVGRGGVGWSPSSEFVTVDPGLFNLLGGGGLLVYSLFLIMLFRSLVMSIDAKFYLIALSFCVINVSENIFSPYNLLSVLCLVLIIKRSSLVRSL